MLFTLIDVILIILVMIFVIGGFVLGLVQAVGALIGVILGAWAAGQYYLPVSEFAAPISFGSEAASKIIAFIIVFILINRIIALLFWLIDKVFNLISIIPFLKSINRFGGAILGLVEGVLAMGLILFVAAKFGANIKWLASSLNGSQVAHWLVATVSFLTGLIT